MKIGETEQNDRTRMDEDDIRKRKFFVEGFSRYSFKNKIHFFLNELLRHSLFDDLGTLFMFFFT